MPHVYICGQTDRATHTHTHTHTHVQASLSQLDEQRVCVRGSLRNEERVLRGGGFQAAPPSRDLASDHFATDKFEAVT